MKIAIDTRHDTLEEALAVVALAFESSGKGPNSKANRPAKQATSGPESTPGKCRCVPNLKQSPQDRHRATRASPTAQRVVRVPERRLLERQQLQRLWRRTRRPRSRWLASQSQRERPHQATVRKSSPAKKAAAAAKAPAAKKSVPKSAPANAKSLTAKRVADKRTTAKQAKARTSKPTNVAPPGQSDTIRAWARSKGMQVGDAGRMSAAVIAAYNAEHD